MSRVSDKSILLTYQAIQQCLGEYGSVDSEHLPLCDPGIHRAKRTILCD